MCSLLQNQPPFFLFPYCKHRAVYVTFFTLHLFGKCKQNLVLVSPAKFFHGYSRGVCQARCVTGLLKSLTVFLIFGQHPKISYTGIFGMAFWHPCASICFLHRTVIFLQNETSLLPRMHRYDDLQASAVRSKRIDFSNH